MKNNARAGASGGLGGRESPPCSVGTSIVCFSESLVASLANLKDVVLKNFSRFAHCRDSDNFCPHSISFLAPSLINKRNITCSEAEIV